MITNILFYMFAVILLASAAMVVSARNPVHSVLFLILSFFNAAALFLIAGAEFLAMILVIVYVGAVAVLFLFVVMMLDIDFAELRGGFQRYLPVGAAVGARAVHRTRAGARRLEVRADATTLRLSATPTNVSNTAALGRLLYTDYVFLFQAAGLVLLVAMIGAIVLTLRDRKTSRHQSIRIADRTHGGGDLEMVDYVARRAGTKEIGNSRRPKVTETGAAPDQQRRMAGTAMHAALTVGLGHYLVGQRILLVLGMFGIFLNRKNVIIILMSIELILLAVNLNLVAFSGALGDLAGQVFAMFVLTVAAAEAAIGLAIVVVYFRNRGSIQVEDVNLMKG